MTDLSWSSVEFTHFAALCFCSIIVPWCWIRPSQLQIGLTPDTWLKKPCNICAMSYWTESEWSGLKHRLVFNKRHMTNHTEGSVLWNHSKLMGHCAELSEFHRSQCSQSGTLFHQEMKFATSDEHLTKWRAQLRGHFSPHKKIQSLPETTLSTNCLS